MELRVAEHGSALYQTSVDLRLRVLRWPLGLDFTSEELAAEASDEHLVAVDDDRVIAVAVATPLGDGVVKMRQVAVDPEWQGKGVGKALVRFFEERAVANGFNKIVLSAREPAVQFYLPLGYSVEGEPFEEVTIPHRKMIKWLSAP